MPAPAPNHLLADEAFRQTLTRRHLPAYLERQRWYTSKGRPLAGITVTALPPLGDAAALWLLEIAFGDGAAETRVLAVAERDRAFAPDDPRVVCRTDGGALVDAVAEEAFRERLYGLMAAGGAVAGEAGVLRGVAGATLRARPAYAGSRVPPQNSSNTVVVYPPDGFFKLFRRTEPGRHPDAELIAYLAEERGFGSVPAFGGALEFAPAGGGEAVTLGLMLGRVDHRGEAWETMLHDVAAYAAALRGDAGLRALDVAGDLASPLRPADLPPALLAAVGEDTVRRLTLLGRRTAEMHVHLAAGEGEGMAPEPLDGDYWAPAVAQLRERLAAEAAYAEDADTRAALGAIDAWLARTRLPRLPAGRTRVHGDYHLGQVLDTAEDVVVIDFEGEPLHSLAYRRRRHPPAKDVAGMVRSLHYAPYAHALREADGAEGAMAAARTWYRLAARLFLTAYRETAGGASFVPRDPRERDALLAFFLADKALYELAYERASRPAWLAIPRAGVRGVGEMVAG